MATPQDFLFAVGTEPTTYLHSGLLGATLTVVYIVSKAAFEQYGCLQSVNYHDLDPDDPEYLDHEYYRGLSNEAEAQYCAYKHKPGQIYDVLLERGFQTSAAFEDFMDRQSDEITIYRKPV